MRSLDQIDVIELALISKVIELKQSNRDKCVFVKKYLLDNN